jgi:predicted MFS family arabinose efflux permease
MPLLAVLSFAAFVSAFTIQLINPLVPAIAREFAISVEQAAMLATGFTLTYALSQPLLGPLGDALGKALIIKVCLGLLGVAMLIGSLATKFEYLFAARMLAGAAGGGIIPVGFAMIGDRFPPEQRQVAISKLVMASQISILLGAMTGGLVADAFSWRQMFIWPTLFTIASFVCALVFLKPRPAAERTPLSLARAKAGYKEAFSGPLAAIVLGGVFCGGLAMFGLLPFIAGRLEQRGLAGLREAGFVIGAMSFGGLMFTFFVRRLLATLGRGGMVRTGGFMVACGMTAIAFSPHWGVEAAGFMITGFGYFMIHNSLQALATDLAPNARGSGVATFACILFLGQALGPVTYRVLFATLGPSLPVVIGAAVLFTVAMVVSHKLYELDRAKAAVTV